MLGVQIMSGVGLLWAGLSLGGNLIAAPAKFQVSDLGLALALQVGRAQFTWLGYAEWVFLATLAVVGFLVRLPGLRLLSCSHDAIPNTANLDHAQIECTN